MFVSKNRKILLVSPSNISEDPRVLAHLRVLQRFGDVTTAGFGPKPTGASAHVQVTEGTSYLPIEVFRKYRLIPKRPIQLVPFLVRQFLAAPTSTGFTRQVMTNLNETQFDLVCANDVHALPVGFQITSRDACPIWVDMHEYAPLENESDWKWRLTIQPYVKFLVNHFLPRATAVSTVGRMIQDRYSVELGRSIDLIRNTSPFIKSSRGNLELIDPRTSFRLVHVGAAIRSRQMEKMINAVKSLDSVSLDMFLVATDKPYYEELTKLAESTHNVRIILPVSLEMVVDSISGYHAGIVGIPPTSYNYANCLPNKFFQYIQARLPIISGPTPEIQEIVEKWQIGWVAESFDQDAICEVIKRAKASFRKITSESLEDAAEYFSREHDDQSREKIIVRVLGIVENQ